MSAADDTERLWSRRLRWRMRGALQWPAFAVLVVYVVAIGWRAWRAGQQATARGWKVA